MSSIIVRRIGEKSVMISHEPGGRKWAMRTLDEEQARYESASRLVDNGINVLVNDLERTHLCREDIKQNTCSKCGYQALKERRDRMRVFGGLFQTDSQPSPYKRCAYCGNDQEYTPYYVPNLQTIERQAQIQLEQASRLIARYSAQTKLKKETNQ